LLRRLFGQENDVALVFEKKTGFGLQALITPEQQVALYQSIRKKAA
jgi:hypothetical protein